jgi:hypothetical protein
VVTPLADLNFSFSAATLKGKTSITLVLFPTDPSLNPIARDKDGVSTLQMTDLWLINGESRTSYRGNIRDSGTTVVLDIPEQYCTGQARYTFGFTVADNFGLARDGQFLLHVCF